jgi:predicted O-linked N-acetylglucosamine transferase (SPINDLY family)
MGIGQAPVIIQPRAGVAGNGPQLVLDLERGLWRRGVPADHCLRLLHDGIARYPDHVGLAARLALRRREMADWQDETPDLAAMILAGGKTSTPLDLHCLLDDPAALARAAASTAEHYRGIGAIERPFARPAVSSRRLRIGYLSGDFREHALGQLAIGPIECHDRTRFEIFGYGTLAGDGSALHQRFLAAFDRYHDLHGAPAETIVDAIRHDEIDILVHLSGYTHGGRCEILSARPAPVVVNYLGFPGTLGMACVDYIIGDPVVLGPGMIEHVREAPVLLPDCYQPNLRRAAPSPPGQRRAHDLPEQALVLACFCATNKIGAPVFARWMAVLREVPDAVLWLLDHPRTNPGPYLREAAARHGVAPDRIVIAPWLTPEAHQARLPLADLALDTAPYGAHTTGSDMLWAGVPMVALLGDAFAARVSASLLRAAGLSDLVATDLDRYEDMILNLARDRRRLAALRRHLVDGRAKLPLFDAPRLTRHLETAFALMWEAHCAGEQPRGFSVVPLQGGGSGSEWPNWAR